jgi:hypothetical protein
MRRSTVLSLPLQLAFLDVTKGWKQTRGFISWEPCCPKFVFIIFFDENVSVLRIKSGGMTLSMKTLSISKLSLSKFSISKFSVKTNILIVTH